MVLSCTQEMSSTEQAPEAAQFEVLETVEVIKVVHDISPPEIDMPSIDAEGEVERPTVVQQQAEPMVTTTPTKEPEVVKTTPILARGLVQLLGGPSAVLPHSTL